MSAARDVVEEAYALAKKGQHAKVRGLLADGATWEPTAKRKWKACENPDEIVRTLVWRTGRANRMRPGETIELGKYVIIRVRGRRLERLGAKGFWAPKIFQVVEVKDGKIVRMRDYGSIQEALAATGHDS